MHAQPSSSPVEKNCALSLYMKGQNNGGDRYVGRSVRILKWEANGDVTKAAKVFKSLCGSFQCGNSKEL